MNYSRFIEQLSLAIQAHEGWYPGSNSYRHNNPGNLRRNGQFIYFPSYYLGFSALEGDVYAKCDNQSSAMTAYYQRNNKTFMTAVFQDLFNVYAPSADNNTPTVYCQKVCQPLAAYGVTPQTPMHIIQGLAQGFISRVPSDNPAPAQPVTVDPPEVLRYLSRLIANTTNVFVKTRLMQRYLSYKAEHGLS